MPSKLKMSQIDLLISKLPEVNNTTTIVVTGKFEVEIPLTYVTQKINIPFDIFIKSAKLFCPFKGCKDEKFGKDIVPHLQTCDFRVSTPCHFGCNEVFPVVCYKRHLVRQHKIPVMRQYGMKPTVLVVDSPNVPHILTQEGKDTNIMCLGIIEAMGRSFLILARERKDTLTLGTVGLRQGSETEFYASYELRPMTPRKVPIHEKLPKETIDIFGFPVNLSSIRKRGEIASAKGRAVANDYNSDVAVKRVLALNDINPQSFRRQAVFRKEDKTKYFTFGQIGYKVSLAVLNHCSAVESSAFD